MSATCNPNLEDPLIQQLRQELKVSEDVRQQLRGELNEATERGRREERLACYDLAMRRSRETPSHSDIARAASSSCAVVADDIAARGPLATPPTPAGEDGEAPVLDESPLHVLAEKMRKYTETQKNLAPFIKAGWDRKGRTPEEVAEWIAAQKLVIGAAELAAAPPAPPEAEGAEVLSFARLRSTNVQRCVEGFRHALGSWSPAEWTNALCGEAGEAANVAKKMLRHRDGVAGNTGDDKSLEKLREKLGRELADVVIYADLTAASQGLDLGELVRETFNRKSEEIGAKEKL